METPLILFILGETFLKSSSILTILSMPLVFEHRFNVDAIWSKPCIDVHTIIQ